MNLKEMSNEELVLVYPQLPEHRAELLSRLEQGEKAIAKIELYKKYLKFIDDANNAPIVIAFTHGWRCPQEDIDMGIKLREELDG